MNRTGPNGSGGGIRILVVEDEPSTREAVQRFLQFRGHHVATAADSEAALQRASESPPEVLVCDWKLAGELDGVDTAASLQGCFDIPVVLVTAHRIEDLKRKVRTSGISVSAYRRKPLSLARLAEAIEAMVPSREAA